MLKVSRYAPLTHENRTTDLFIRFVTKITRFLLSVTTEIFFLAKLIFVITLQIKLISLFMTVKPLIKKLEEKCYYLI